MYLEVSLQKYVLLEHFLTDVTFESLLTISGIINREYGLPFFHGHYITLVFSDMLYQMRRLQNHLSTHLALMFGVFLVINHQMPPEVCHRVERFSTVVTCVYSSSAMGQHVSFQMRGTEKGSVADFTLVLFFLLVLHLMLKILIFIKKSLFTSGTSERAWC